MYNAYYICCINNYNGCNMTYKLMDILFKILLYVLRFFFYFFLYFCQVGGVTASPGLPGWKALLLPLSLTEGMELQRAKFPKTTRCTLEKTQYSRLAVLIIMGSEAGQ